MTKSDQVKARLDRMQPVIEHLSHVAYFQRIPANPVDLVAGCSVIAHGLFGNRKAYLIGKVVKENGREIENYRQSFRLGDSFTIDVDQTRIDTLVAYSPAPRARRHNAFGVYEALWDVSFECEQVFLGLKHGPTLRLGISLEQMSPELVPKLTQVAVDFAALVAGFDSFTYGFCDVGDFRDTVTGRLYGGAWLGNANFRSQLRRMIWTRAGHDRLHLARDVFWGNILGTEMVRKLGGEAWLRHYQDAVGPGKDPLVFPFSHGTLVLISGQVKHVRYGPASPSIPTLDRASYLYAELAKARLLCGMPQRDDH